MGTFRHKNGSVRIINIQKSKAAAICGKQVWRYGNGLTQFAAQQREASNLAFC